MTLLFAAILWSLVWGGMFTGYYNIPDLFAGNAFHAFQALRAFLPLAALYLTLIWLFKERPKFPFFKDPLGFLYLYCLVGLAASGFLSPAVGQSLYCAGIYLAPLVVMWPVLSYSRSRWLLRTVIYINYAVFFFLTIALLPEAVRIFRGRASFSAFYNLPFGFGQVTKNGVGRYALIVIIVSATRLLAEKRRRRRWLWLAALLPSLFLLMQTQSRTALLGLSVVSILYVIMKGLDFRLLLAAPVVGFIIFTAGFKLRAQGRWDYLVNLSGRETTWGKALLQIGQSPFLGWGFDADRILMQSEHMHNSFLHALIQAGAVGTLFFFAALASIWIYIWKTHLLEHCRDIRGEDQTLLMESIMIVAFLTSRSFFESTAAFYGVDLLLLIPAMAFIGLFAREGGGDTDEAFPEVV